MHSSRMCTTCLLTVSQHALPGGGVPSRGVYLPWGCTYQLVYLPVVYLPGGVPAEECTCPGGGGVPAQGGVPAWGVYLSMGYLPGGVPTQVLPTVNRMTDRCKNITLQQTSFAGCKNAFLLLPLGSYLLPLSSGNICLPTCSNEKLFLQLWLGMYLL